MISFAHGGVALAVWNWEPYGGDCTGCMKTPNGDCGKFMV